MDLWHVLHVLLRRKWVILAAGLLTALAASAAHFLMGSYYRGSVFLLPSEAALQGVTSLNPGLQPPESGAGVRQARLANLVALAQDPALAGAVSRSLLGEGIELDGERLLRDVEVRTVTGDGGQATALVRIDVEGQEPERVRAIADRWASVFIGNYRRMVAEGVDQTVAFLSRQRDEAKQQLDAAENNIVRFRRARGFVAVDEEKGRAVSALGARRSEWQAAVATLADVGAQLAWVESRLAGTSPTRSEALAPEPSTLARELQQLIDQEETRLTAELATKTEEHWDVRPIRRRLEALRRRLAEEESKARVAYKVAPDPEFLRLQEQRATLEGRKRAAEARLARLEQALLAERQEVRRFTDADIAMARLTRARQLAEARYLTFAEKLSDALLQRRVLQERNYLSRSPIDRAGVVVEGPISRAPNLIPLALVGFLVGLGLGVATLLAIDAMDTSAQTPDEVEALVGLPVAGLIPTAQGVLPAQMLPRITHLRPTSAHAEAYRFLASDLLMAAAEADVRVVMVATAKPGQGGTSTIANLAITLAQAGRRVALVDADLRRPRLHEIFDQPVEPGLANVLANGMGPREALRSTDVEGLVLLPAGASPENPWQLLRSPKMFRVIEAVRDSVDFVLIDTPSALVFADALTLTRYVDGVFVVIRARAAAGRELQVKTLLNRANAPILGVVLNDVDGAEVDAYRYHHHYYGRDAVPAVETRIPRPPKPALPVPESDDVI
jgi:capsular exopolysaccharide synthesis family protein